MILSCSNIAKSFGGNEVIKNCSFSLEEREKAAIVGINGAGKTTLLKIIIQELAPDSGQVILAKGKTIGYLAQHQDLSSENTIYGELLSVKSDIIDMENKMRVLEQNMKNASENALTSLLEQYARINHEFELQNGYAYKSEVTGVLKGLGFIEEEFSKLVNTLSGGQKTRISLGKLLLSKPDIILLDEPTNHLDLESVKWLEGYLLNYNGSILTVAHDRYFLDKIAQKIIELEHAQCTVFIGNYTVYSQKKAVLRNMHMKEYLNRQKEIRRQEEVIIKLKQFNREKSIKRAESREKLLNKIEVIEKPAELNDKMNICLNPKRISGNDVLSVENLEKSFDNKILFSGISFEIKRGERIALIGNNGAGKTTLLKIINSIILSDKGTVKPGANVCIGYYDQEHNILNPENTLFDEMAETYPGLTNTEIRNTLAAFLFTGDDVFKYIKDLSGGEKGRVSLAKLMLSEANFLILDEPTNHLDMVSKEILENALNLYTGTILYVSHDRYFINATATRILELTNLTVVNYIGNYHYYEEKREQLTAGLTAPELYAPPPEPSASRSWKSTKEEQARLRKHQNELKKTEEEISRTEEEIIQINELAVTPEYCSDTVKLLELYQKKESLEIILNHLYEKWEKLSY